MAVNFRTLPALCATVTGVFLIVAGLCGHAISGDDPNATLAAGVAVITLGLWISGAIPEFFTSLLFLLMAAGLMIAPPDRVFSGFHSNAMWLIFGGLIIGQSVIASGLGDRIVSRLFAFAPSGYLGALAAVAVTGLGLSFIVPTAIGRAVLMAPIAVQLAKRLGFSEGSKGRSGLVLTAGLSTSLPAFTILPSNVPNLVMTGTAENLYEVSFSYGDYLAINFPVLGGLGLATIVALSWWFFRDSQSYLSDVTADTKISGVELRLAIVLTTTVILWITDSWHGVSPAWIAMGAALLCASPVVGALAMRELPQKMNFAPLFFVAGVIGFGAVVADTGLSAQAGTYLVNALDMDGLQSDIAVFAALSALGMLVAAGTTVPTAPAIMTPLAEQLSVTTGWSIESVLLVQVPTWVIIPLPYLVPPILLTMSVGKVPSGHGLYLMLSYFVVGLFILAPTHFAWAHWLGVFH
ncbi:SLC13 family permease [Shimia sp.]|uniref:SLC13 family permease n=1 Tax=Shimia sp. TaxID=1954381 RepID=UPI0032988441